MPSIVKGRVLASAGLALALATLSAGCSLSPLGRHTAAFADATVIVVDRSEDAYRTANRLYFEEQVATAVRNYDHDTHWDPRSIQPLLTPKQMQIRIELLEALKDYAKLVAEIEASSKSRALESASAGAGSGLRDLSETMPSSLGGGTQLSALQTNALSTATRLLAGFLIARKVKRELPKALENMDPQIDTLCRILRLDISTLQAQAEDDYSNLLTQQDAFVRGPGQQLNPVERRTEIERMPMLVQRAQASKSLFDQLDTCLQRLAAAHRALASAARDKNDAVLKARIADLSSSGASLAQLYTTLPVR